MLALINYPKYGYTESHINYYQNFARMIFFITERPRLTCINMAKHESALKTSTYSPIIIESSENMGMLLTLF